MDNQLKYDYFKFRHDLEYDAYKELMNRSKLYLSIITFYLGILLFKSVDLIEFQKNFELKVSDLTWLLYLSSVILFSFGLFFTIRSLEVQISYMGNKMPEFFLSIDEKVDKEIFSEILANLARAESGYGKVNNKRKRFLKYTTISISIGLLFSVLFLFSVAYPR